MCLTTTSDHGSRHVFTRSPHGKAAAGGFLGLSQGVVARRRRALLCYGALTAIARA